MIAYLGVGSNLGDREMMIKNAIDLLGEKTVVEKKSALYETDPVGYQHQNKFINVVVKCRTVLTPRELLVFCHGIENQLKRVRMIVNGPRTIDIDILLCDNLIIKEPGLIVPHPRFHERDFVLKPFLDVDPEVVHPVLKKSIGVLINNLVGGGNVC